MGWNHQLVDNFHTDFFVRKPELKWQMGFFNYNISEDEHILTSMNPSLKVWYKPYRWFQHSTAILQLILDFPSFSHCWSIHHWFGFARPIFPKDSSTHVGCGHATSRWTSRSSLTDGWTCAIQRQLGRGLVSWTWQEVLWLRLTYIRSLYSFFVTLFLCQGRTT